LLAAPWPGLRGGYAAAYRYSINRIIPILDLEYQIRVRPHPKARDVDESFAVVHERGSGRRIGALQVNTRAPYLASALTAALILSTPLSWRRRCRALLAGLLLTSAYLAIRLPASVLYLLSLHSVDAHDGSLRFALEKSLLGGVAFAPWYAIPVLVWFVVACRPAFQERIVDPLRALRDGPRPDASSVERADGNSTESTGVG
jgi:hypothetical protein